MNALPWLFALTAFVSLDARIIAPVLPAIAESLGVSPGDAGLAMTAYTLPYGAMQVVGPRIPGARSGAAVAGRRRGAVRHWAGLHRRARDAADARH